MIHQRAVEPANTMTARLSPSLVMLLRQNRRTMASGTSCRSTMMVANPYGAGRCCQDGAPVRGHRFSLPRPSRPPPGAYSLVMLPQLLHQSKKWLKSATDLSPH